jgi:hypothetical protein
MACIRNRLEFPKAPITIAQRTVQWSGILAA